MPGVLSITVGSRGGRPGFELDPAWSLSHDRLKLYIHKVTVFILLYLVSVYCIAQYTTLYLTYCIGVSKGYVLRTGVFMAALAVVLPAVGSLYGAVTGQHMGPPAGCPPSVRTAVLASPEHEP